MKRSRPLVVLSMAVLATLLILTSAGPAVAGTGDVNFFLGQKMLKKSDWEPFENQPEFGAEVSFGKQDWPVLIATDLFGSARERTEFGVKVTASTSELDIGVRKIWEKGRIRPYIGGGFGSIEGKVEAETGGSTVSSSDSAFGAWLGGGVFWRIGTRFNIGASARWSQAKINAEPNTEVEAGGFHLGLLLGWGWPKTQ